MNFHYENLDWENTKGTLDERLFSVCIVTDIDGNHDIFWGDSGYPDSYRLTVAWDEDGDPAGILLYDRLEDDHIYCSTVWTDAKYRRQGIASNLWRVTLATEEPKVASMYCISDESLALHKKIESQFSDVVWLIDTEALDRAVA